MLGTLKASIRLGNWVFTCRVIWRSPGSASSSGFFAAGTSRLAIGPKYRWARVLTSSGVTSPTTTSVALFGTYQDSYQWRSSSTFMRSRSAIQPMVGV
ncbi:hypothetical protein D3C81_1422380 [compost metagenome]